MRNISDHRTPIKIWMTPGYIAHSWHIPRHDLMEAIGAPRPVYNRPKDRPRAETRPQERGPLNLQQLAILMEMTDAQMLTAVQDAIAQITAEH